MIRLNLFMFGGRGSSSGGGGGGGTGSAGRTGSGGSGSKKVKIENPESFTNNDGNVMRIVNGYKYNIYHKNGDLFSDKLTPEDAKDYLDEYEYDPKSGMFIDKNNRNRGYIVKIVRRKK